MALSFTLLMNKLVALMVVFLFGAAAGAALMPVHQHPWSPVPALPRAVGPQEVSYAFARNYSELVGWYQSLEADYPEYIEVFKANELYGTGTVTGGYDLYYVRITNESRGLHKPEVLFLGSPHGSEQIGTNCLYWFADWWMRHAWHPDYGSGQREWLRWLLDTREVYFEISHNPWGFDRRRRWDANGWDLNREADYNGPGEWGSPEPWGSVQGKTLVRFVNNHTIRTGCDFHEGLRKLMYPWFNSHWLIKGLSPVSLMLYNYAPPDFYFYDVASLRLGDYMGDFGGDLNAWNIAPLKSALDRVEGALVAWAYGADVDRHPREDRFVQDEAYGPYPGSGIMWHLYEVYDYEKNIPRQDLLGGDETLGFGMEVRRFLLHQIDLAQPSVRWRSTPQSPGTLSPGTFTFSWQVNGSLVVDHTFLQWGTDPDPTKTFAHATPDYDEYTGAFQGGTGWDGAHNGTTSGVVYTAALTFEEPGEYYVVATAQVDQRYGTAYAPLAYGQQPYLRLVQERTNDTYHEVRQGTDGIEEITGQLWWYSPIIHLTVTA
jgi:hypothetical protein